ncbi:MAG: hypothetical protein IPK26_15315 [Planctomycetes bacterium]|nr:hypothetical protein [Planctomycetota bacterium]
MTAIPRTFVPAFLTFTLAAQGILPDWTALLPIGSPLDGGIRDLAVGPTGITYVVGDQGPSSNTDIVIAAYAPGGALLWSRIFNGPANAHDQARALTLAPNGNLYVTGNTTGPGNYANVLLLRLDAQTGALLTTVQHSGGAFLSETGTAIAATANGDVYVGGSSSADALLLRFDGAGTLLWRRTWDGPATGPFSQDHLRRVQVGPDGNPVALIHGVLGGSQPDYVVIKYAAATGTPLWQANWGVAGGDYPSELAIDGVGDVLASGIGINGTANMFATIKLRGGDGGLIWQAYDNNGFRPAVRAMTLDADGDVYVTGSVDPDGDQSNNNDDFFTVKRDGGSGARLWTHAFGANCRDCLDLPSDLVVDVAGNLWLAGTTSSPPSQGDLLLLVLDSQSGIRNETAVLDAGVGRSVGAAFVALDAAQNLLVGGQSRDANLTASDIVVGRFPTRPTVTNRGVGCTGSGALPLAIVPIGTPIIPNPALAIALRDGPAASLQAVALAFGLAQVPQPVPHGAPGCIAFVDPATVVATPVATGGVLPMPIPAVSALRGVQFAAQGFALDGTQFQLVTSNALVLMLGQ